MLVLQNQLSGNLLRKFKNSTGWQKLWVVFTNFCLFFYKSHQVSAAPWADGRKAAGGGAAFFRKDEEPGTPATQAWVSEGRSPAALERATGCWLNTGGGRTCLRDKRLRLAPPPTPVATAPKPPSVDSAQDNHPLASLPLLGYSLTIPSEAEDIHKDYVFKLHFKSHVYYFRAESEYTFER